MFDPGDIDAVVFDSGGVLLLPAPESFRHAVAAFGLVPDDEQCRRAHYASTWEVDRIRTVDWPRIDGVVATELGVSADQLGEATPRVAEAYEHGAYTPVAGAAEALVALQARDYALAVVSNAFGSMEAMLAEHQICSVNGATRAQVSVVIDSHVVGIEKPDPAIFRLALDALDVAPERSLYVGDTVYFDIDGAEAAGMVGMHLDPYGACPSAGHPHLRDLAELVVALG